jgi:glycosyltransferase involved in cell wall biosynthesis
MKLFSKGLRRLFMYPVNILKRILLRYLFNIRMLEQYPASLLKIPTYDLNRNPNIDEKKLPVISIVTPSYQQADFISRTMESVLNQNYPNLEYIVQDAGSGDGSFEIIKSFENRLTYFESRPDNGQAHALNLGFQRTHGEIMAYLNADDILMSESLRCVAHYFETHPKVDVIYSHRIIINEDDKEVGRWILPPHYASPILWADYIPQETMFWRRSIWEKVSSQIDESFSFAMDWDLIIRFHMAGARFVRLPCFLAAFRVHSAQKTSLHLKQIGEVEMQRLRKRILNRDIAQREVMWRIVPYFFYSFFYHILYRIGIIRD